MKNVSLGIRIANLLIDQIGFQLILSIFNIPVNLDYFFLQFLFYVLLFLVYYFLFEYFFQKTPGKFLTKTIVVDRNGNKPSLKQIFIRSFSRAVPFEPLSFLGDEVRGWHDKWSETWVVSISEVEELKKLQANN